MQRELRGRRFTCRGRRAARRLHPASGKCSPERAATDVPGCRLTRGASRRSHRSGPVPCKASSVGSVKLPPVAGYRTGRITRMMAGLSNARRARLRPVWPEWRQSKSNPPREGDRSGQRRHAQIVLMRDSPHRPRRRMSRCRPCVNGASCPDSDNGGSRWTRCRKPLFANGRTADPRACRTGSTPTPTSSRASSERIFRRRRWLYVCLEAEIPNPGDFKRSRLGAREVVAVRDSDGAINVLVNRCAHRSMQFCTANRGTAKEFVCPYHQWTYDLDGNLLGVPFRRGYQRPGRHAGRLPTRRNTGCKPRGDLPQRRRVRQLRRSRTSRSRPISGRTHARLFRPRVRRPRARGARLHAAAHSRATGS